MTPCEKLGYKVGDRFRVIESRHPGRNGSIVTLRQDDGTYAPYFKSADGDIWVFKVDNSGKDHIEKIECEPDTLTTILESAAEHGAKAKHHAAEHERLMAEAKSLMPDGWRLVRDGESASAQAPTQDMSDPANWREGDVVECVETIHDTKKGKLYTLEVDPGDGKLSFRDDAGDFCSIGRTKLRFHHRP